MHTLRIRIQRADLKEERDCGIFQFHHLPRLHDGVIVALDDGEPREWGVVRVIHKPSAVPGASQPIETTIVLGWYAAPEST